MNDALLFVLVLVLTCATDVAWTRYTIAVADRHAHKAALWSALIILGGAFAVIAYTHNPALVLAACIGAYLGTWWAARSKRREPEPAPVSLRDHVHTGVTYCKEDDCTKCNTPSPQGHGPDYMG